MNIPIASFPSPCTGICKLDEVLGWCRGCGRTEEEIAEWPSAGDARRQAIWDLLPARVDALGIAITRLPWRRGRIAEFAAESLFGAIRYMDRWLRWRGRRIPVLRE